MIRSSTPIERLTLQRMFQGLSEEQLRSIHDIGNIFAVDPGEVIIQSGQMPTHLYFILDGEVDIYILDNEDEQQEKLLTTLATGDSVGEYGFVDQRVTSATVKAACYTELFALSAKMFADLLRNDVQLENLIYKNLLTTLVDRLRMSNIVIDYLQSKERRPAPDIH